MKLLEMSNFAFFHNVFYAICILKSINSHIPVVICSFFELETVSKWCIREWVNVCQRSGHTSEYFWAFAFNRCWHVPNKRFLYNVNVLLPQKCWWMQRGHDITLTFFHKQPSKKAPFNILIALTLSLLNKCIVLFHWLKSHFHCKMKKQLS